MSVSPIPALGELEFAVLDHLWAHGAQDAKSVHAALGRPRRITLNTIQSTLKRLFDKGLLERDKISHAHVYQPCIDRAAFQRRVVEAVLDRVSGGAPSDLVAAFYDLTERASVDQLEELERLVARRIEERRRGGRA